MTIKIGITGTIGSGKSMVGQVLSDLGVPVLDTDMVVHRLYRQPFVVAKLCHAFGEGCRGTDAEVDRAALGQLVFSDAEKRSQLEALIHPLVRQETEAFLARATQDDISVVAVLVPLLFEGHSENLYDEVWTVFVEPGSLLKERLRDRHPHWTEADLEARLSSQWSQAEKKAHADWVIDNSGSCEETAQQVKHRLRQLQETSVV